MTIVEALLMLMILILLMPAGLIGIGYVAHKLGLIGHPDDDAAGDNDGDGDE